MAKYAGVEVSGPVQVDIPAIIWILIIGIICLVIPFTGVLSAFGSVANVILFIVGILLIALFVVIIVLEYQNQQQSTGF